MRSDPRSGSQTRFYLPQEALLLDYPPFYLYGVLPVLERHLICPVMISGWGGIPNLPSGLLHHHYDVRMLQVSCDL